MNYTPVRQLPYLEGTDAMSAVPSVIQALAEAIELQVYSWAYELEGTP